MKTVHFLIRVATNVKNTNRYLNVLQEKKGTVWRGKNLVKMDDLKFLSVANEEGKTTVK